MSKKRTAWVLDTETKGTGAEMVPLERLQERKRLRGRRERIRVIDRTEPEAQNEPQIETPRGPRRFRIVDVLTRRALADDVGVSDALQVLSCVERIVDANVYVWEPGKDDWRPLTMPERRTLWG